MQHIICTPEAEASFAEIKLKINACPKLFFMYGKLPIFLQTDASDYAIGSYLFQMKEGKEISIRFMSKTLVAQIRWSTIEKECFLMYYSLKKFADLLLGVPFLLRTDHRNLLYLNEAGSAKVTRWKIEIQNYNFRIEHIPGVENISADVFSRLIKPYEARTVLLNVLTRRGRGGGNKVGQKGLTEGSGAITTILHNVSEEGPASQAELVDDCLQLSYSEERGRVLPCIMSR
jgi:hypothetical protein